MQGGGREKKTEIDTSVDCKHRNLGREQEEDDRVPHDSTGAFRMVNEWRSLVIIFFQAVLPDKNQLVERRVLQFLIILGRIERAIISQKNDARSLRHSICSKEMEFIRENCWCWKTIGASRDVDISLWVYKRYMREKWGEASSRIEKEQKREKK